MILLACSQFILWQFTNAAQPSGYVIEWGWNTGTGKAMPAKVVLSNAVAISPGRIQCLALKDNGSVIAWSWDRKGEITFDNVSLSSGVGGFTDKTGFHVTHTNTTTTMTNGIVIINGKNLNGVTSIAVGSGFGIALKRDGTIVSWGENATPDCPSNIVAIAAASYVSLAVKNDGTVIQWVGAEWFPGRDQLIEVPGLTNIIAVAIGAAYQGTRNIALKSDGTVVHWGSESTEKEATPPEGLSNVVSVAAGSGHSLALKSDGTVVGWGFNDVGQATGVPTKNAPHISSGPVVLNGLILSNVVSVAANDNYSMALKNDGTIAAWGRMVNNLYPATVPAGLSNVVAIAAGDHFCLAITTNKAVAESFSKK